MSGDAIEATGHVVEAQRGGLFRVAVGAPLAREVLCRIGGRMRKFHVRVVAGDLVSVEVSPYDLGRGRIMYRGERPRREA